MEHPGEEGVGWGRFPGGSTANTPPVPTRARRGWQAAQNYPCAGLFPGILKLCCSVSAPAIAGAVPLPSAWHQPPLCPRHPHWLCRHRGGWGRAPARLSSELSPPPRHIWGHQHQFWGSALEKGIPEDRHPLHPPSRSGHGDTTMLPAFPPANSWSGSGAARAGEPPPAVPCPHAWVPSSPPSRPAGVGGHPLAQPGCVAQPPAPCSPSGFSASRDGGLLSSPSSGDSAGLRPGNLRSSPARSRKPGSCGEARPAPATSAALGHTAIPALAPTGTHSPGRAQPTGDLLL